MVEVFWGLPFSEQCESIFIVYIAKGAITDTTVFLSHRCNQGEKGLYDFQLLFRKHIQCCSDNDHWRHLSNLGPADSLDAHAPGFIRKGLCTGLNKIHGKNQIFLDFSVDSLKRSCLSRFCMRFSFCESFAFFCFSCLPLSLFPLSPMVSSPLVVNDPC